MECNCVTQGLSVQSSACFPARAGFARVMTVLVGARSSCVTCAICLVACAGAPEPQATASGIGLEQYRSVVEIITESCAKQTCHGELSANAHLDFMQADIRAAVVGVRACEYSGMARVEPGAPERSWVMMKLAGPTRFRDFADFVDFTPAPDWQPGAPECSGMFPDGAHWFGTRMPPPDTTTITQDQIETIRDWIANGAPGP